MILLITWWKTKKIIKAIPPKNGQKLPRSRGWERRRAFKAIWSIMLITNSSPIFGRAGMMCSELANMPLSALWWCHARVWGNLSSWLMDLLTRCPDNLKDNTFINYSCRCWQIQSITTLTSTQALSQQHSMSGHLTIRLPALLRKLSQLKLWHRKRLH